MYDHKHMLIIEQGPYCHVITNSIKSSVGEKDDDHYFMSGEIVGRHAIRLPLMELLSVGARLQAVSVTSMNELVPTTEVMLKGMEVELGIMKVPILINSENHFKSTVTGIGITLMGRVAKANMLLGRVAEGNQIWLHGAPVAGMDVTDNTHRLPTPEWVAEVASQKGVRELVLCGPDGIASGLDKMCKAYGLNYELNDSMGIDLKKSCGPYGGIVIVATSDFVRDDVVLLGRLIA